MRLALILSDFADRMRALQRNLADEFSVIVGRSVAEGLDLLQTLPVDLLLVDLDSDGTQGEDLPERVRECRPHCAVVAVVPEGGESGGGVLAYDAALRADSTPYEISAVLARLMERQRLLEEIEQQRAEIRRLQARSERLQAHRAPAQPVDKLIKAFSRALSSGFDQERLLNLFADTVLEMMRVSKVSVLLVDSERGEYRVCCHRGLRPDVAEGLRLRTGTGLAGWLAREGRIMTRELAEEPGTSPEIRKEMAALQAEVSIPMMRSGMLIGVLNLNGRITGSPLLEDELETLFTLASHLAIAVQEMGALRHTQSQQDFNAQLLAHLSCGVISINTREQIVACNERAALLLGRQRDDLLHRDLRRVPSPLGDMLFETLTTGRCYVGEEVTILAERVPLEVSTYPVKAVDGTLLGSAVVFDDLRRRLRLERQRRHADRAAVLQRLLGRVASEVRRPLGQIRQLGDRLPDTLPNEETLQEARQVLRVQLRRLDALADGLAAYAGVLDYRQHATPLAGVVSLALRRVKEDGLPGDALDVRYTADAGEEMVRVDSEQMASALAHLLRYALEQRRGDALVELVVSRLDADPAPGELAPYASLHLRYHGQATAADIERMLDPVAHLDADALDDAAMGLLVSRRIVEAHEGTLSASLGEDGTCQITLGLPLAGAEKQGSEQVGKESLQAV